VTAKARAVICALLNVFGWAVFCNGLALNIETFIGGILLLAGFGSLIVNCWAAPAKRDSDG